MSALPCALTIAGLDPSGGAGITADLRGFAAAGAWGCAALAVLTVQSTAGLRSAHPVPKEQLEAQVLELFRHQNLRAIKTGALGTAEGVRTVVGLVEQKRELPLVVDPVLVATRAHDGARLLDQEGLVAMKELCARATLVTPNVTEAEALTGLQIRTVQDAMQAAKQIVELGARAAVVTGGHLEGDAVDALATRTQTFELSAPRVSGSPLHGSGCTFASLVAGRLAVAAHPIDDEGLLDAVRWAKAKVTEWIEGARYVGDGLRVLGG